MRKSRVASLFAGLSLVLSAPLASSAIIVTDPTITDIVPGISTFETTGADMVGMTVTMNFATGSETVLWQATAPNCGGAFGTGWSISQCDTTFSNPWEVDLGTDLLLLTMLIDASTGLTLFDRTDDSGFALQGTPGTASGRDYLTDLAGDAAIVAIYSREVAVGALAPVGDIWHQIFVDFAALQGVRGQFTFLQDTDNDIRRQVPEPGILGLFALALAGLGFAVRRARLW